MNEDREYDRQLDKYLDDTTMSFQQEDWEDKKQDILRDIAKLGRMIEEELDTCINHELDDMLESIYDEVEKIKFENR